MKYFPAQIASFVNGEISNSKDINITHVSIDSRSIHNSIKSVFFALKSNNRNGHDYIPELIEKGVKTFVVSEDLKIDVEEFCIIKVKDTLTALQDFATAHRNKFNIPIIGITGSYGKTMVKEWLYQLLAPEYSICRSPKSYNSQIGVALSVLQLEETDTLGIFEAGISKTGEMENLQRIIKPSVGVLTKMGEAHQEGFNSLDEKKKEKLILFKDSKTIITLDINSDGILIPFKDQSSIENCQLCISVMNELGYDSGVIQERINKLEPLALRLEMKKGKNSSVILNDGYNISLSSLALSLDYLSQQANGKPKTLIISSIPETSFSDNSFIELINNQDLDRIIVIGREKLEGVKVNDILYFESTSEIISAINTISFDNNYILIKGSRLHNFELIAQELEYKNHRTVLEVNLSQLRKNLSVYKELLKPKTKLMVMVKAFSYGSGTTEIPKFLEQEGIDYMGVAYTNEGISLREAGIKTPIMVMNPEPSSFSDLIENCLEPEIYSLQELDEFIRALILKRQKEYPIHIKLETGMNRLGFVEQDIIPLIKLIKSQPEVYVKSMFSHLSSADSEQEKSFTLKQLEKFNLLSSQISTHFSYPIDKHVLNTAGIENYSDYQFDMVRLGIGLYGISGGNNNLNIKPVSTLKTVIIQLKEVNAGDSIGYGRQTQANQDMTIAILPIGYSDGLRRSLGNRNYQFYTNDQYCDVVGNVCMDICMIDVTGLKVKVGDEVEIFGPNNSVEKLANAMGTIPYEVLTSISQRVKRVFVQE